MRNLAGFRINKDRPSGDKDTRLEPFAVQAEGKNVRLLRGLWNEDWIEELCALPNGERRDQADATAGAFNMLVSKGSPYSGMSRIVAKMPQIERTRRGR